MVTVTDEERAMLRAAHDQAAARQPAPPATPKRLGDEIDLHATIAKLRANASRPVLSAGEEADATRVERWAAAIPARLRHAARSTLDREQRHHADCWVQDPTRNLVVLGAVGRGKTHLAVACARHAYDTGTNVVFWPAVELLYAMQPYGQDRVYDRAVSAGLLVLDDLGVEPLTEWKLGRLYSLINRRWLEERPTIVTSNLDVTRGPNGQPSEIEQAVTERVWSRLLDGAHRALLTGADRRRSPLRAL
jgi:DNA replication protein DnaC